ncbi:MULTISPECIES: TldD/PmbA family protein [Subtercola]|uniref:TldD/PmbA family protein n=1 Tax=Subtercola vilae TaxID=2056433 RepID=A0A4T2BSY3_9MICO|nr:MULTISPECIES: TldD/PmbA family protein [Subtercola]MEA9986169.1 TldD/PmbA family protein [Subtercola sp. RTI3]TIH33551.1 TldD/PmbA family protein [Subtercola vilae]
MTDTANDIFAPAFGGDRATSALEEALESAPADRIEAFITSRRGDFTRFAGQRIHQSQAIDEVQIMVRAEVDGRVSRAAASSFGALRAAVDRSCAAAAQQAADKVTPAPRQTPLADPGADLGASSFDSGILWGEDTAAWSVGEHARLADRAMNEAQALGGVAAGMFGRAVTEVAFHDREAHLSRHAFASEAQGSLTVRIDDGSSHWKDLTRFSDRLGADAAIDRTLSQASRTRGRAKLEPGRYDVVLGPLAAGELLDFFGAFGFTGSALGAGFGTVATRGGEQVASPLVSVHDDATADIGLPFPFDFQGTSKRDVPMISNGRAQSVVTDRETAFALGSESTGNFHIAREEAPHAIPMNVVLRASDSTEDDLIAGIENGVYLQRFWYTRTVDPVNTTITGVTRDACFMIENGRIAYPVESMRFTMSVLDALARVDGVGTDSLSQPLMNVFNGSASSPAIRVRGFSLGTAPVSKGNA